MYKYLYFIHLLLLSRYLLIFIMILCKCPQDRHFPWTLLTGNVDSDVFPISLPYSFVIDFSVDVVISLVVWKYISLKSILPGVSYTMLEKMVVYSFVTKIKFEEYCTLSKLVFAMCIYVNSYTYHINHHVVHWWQMLSRAFAFNSFLPIVNDLK